MASLDVKRKFEELEATYIDRQVMQSKTNKQECFNQIGSWHCSSSSIANSRESGALCRSVLDALFQCVEFAYKHPPDATQRKIIKGMVSASFDGIFEKASELEKQKAKQAYGITKTNCRFMVITPRRCGKTTAVAMFAAAYVLSKPSSTTCIFSVSKRASSMLMYAIKQNIENLKDRIAHTTVVSNAESLKIEVDGDERSVHAYPASLHTLRGVGGDLIILEEAAFIPTEIIQQIVTPLLEVRGTALCCISTPMDSTNIYSQMAEMKTSEGVAVFEVLKIQLACDECIATKDDPTTCQHVDVIPPAWKDQNRQKASVALYGNNKQLLLRETMGIITGSIGQVWSNNTIRGFLYAPKVAMTQVPLLIMTMIDPSGGGGSQQAISTVLLYDSGTPTPGYELMPGFQDSTLFVTSSTKLTVCLYVGELTLYTMQPGQLPPYSYCKRLATC